MPDFGPWEKTVNPIKVSGAEINKLAIESKLPEMPKLRDDPALHLLVVLGHQEWQCIGHK